MADHRFRYAPQYPTFHARVPVGTHSDQIVRGFTRKRNDLIRGEAVLGNMGDLLDPNFFISSAFFSR